MAAVCVMKGEEAVCEVKRLSIKHGGHEERACGDKR